MEADCHGLISKIEHGSTHDGSGFRSVVYFAGCPLACKWCHNPELIAPRAQLMYFPYKCIGCGNCRRVCPDVFSENQPPRRENCTLCGKCIAGCPADALQLSAQRVSAKAVFAEVEADKVYYRHSGGGVTFTGGECFVQKEFLKDLLIRCKDAGIHTCVESCLFVPFSAVAELSPLIDHFFVDIKLMDSEKHKIFTGQPNEKILDNIRKLRELDKDITFRLPLIPGVNDGWDNLCATAAFINDLPGRTEKKLELLRYNNLASGKYESLGIPFHSFGSPQPKEELTKLAHALDSLYDDVCVFCHL